MKTITSTTITLEACFVDWLCVIVDCLLVFVIVDCCDVDCLLLTVDVDCYLLFVIAVF